MLIPLIIPLLGPRDAGMKLFDAAQDAHIQLKSGSVRIVRRMVSNGTATDQTLDLSFVQPSTGTLRIRGASSDRVYRVSGETLTGYDRDMGTYLVRQGLHGTDLLGKFVSALGPVEDPVSLLLSPAQMQRWISLFRGPGWTVQSGNTVTLTRRVGNASGTIVLDPKTKLLTRVQFLNGASTLAWSVTYGAKPVPFSIPPSAVQVRAFRTGPQGIIYANDEARSTVGKLIRAGIRLNSAVVQATSPEGKARLCFGGGKYREDRKGMSWAFDGRTLALRVGKSFFTGRAKRSEIVDLISLHSARVDPLLREVLVGGVPFLNYLSKGTRVSIAGKSTVGGARCTILSLRQPWQRSSLFVRPDGLLQSASSDVIGPKNEVMGTTTRTFTFSGLRPQERFTLNRQPGDRVGNLRKR